MEYQCVFTGFVKVLNAIVKILALNAIKSCFGTEQIGTDMRKLLAALSFLFSIALYNCGSEKSYVYSNVTGEAFADDKEKDYKGYNPHQTNDTLYRRYERSDSLTASEIYDNKEETEE